MIIDGLSVGCPDRESGHERFGKDDELRTAFGRLLYKVARLEDGCRLVQHHGRRKNAGNRNGFVGRGRVSHHRLPFFSLKAASCPLEIAI